MKALVLTFDKYRQITEHMIRQYEKIWPDHPFQFHIPYQSVTGLNNSKRIFTKSSKNIKKTVLNLLRNIDDEEWVYWCIDDKYPIEFSLPKIKQIYQWISNLDSNEISGVLFCRCRNLLKSRYLTGSSILDSNANSYLERNSFEQIWIHQFVRAKVIRYLFKSFPDGIIQAKMMDRYKSNVQLPDSMKLYVTEENLAVFGESTSRGYITQNCYASMVQNNITLPDWHQTTNNIKILMGTLPSEPSSNDVNQVLFSKIKKIISKSIFKR